MVDSACLAVAGTDLMPVGPRVEGKVEVHTSVLGKLFLTVLAVDAFQVGLCAECACRGA